jgi:hypothetical protein
LFLLRTILICINDIICGQERAARWRLRRLRVEIILFQGADQGLSRRRRAGQAEKIIYLNSGFLHCSISI